MQIWLFDIDGTLIDTGGAGRQAMIHAMADAFRVAGDGQAVEFAGRTDRAITCDLFQTFRVPLDETTWDRYQAVYLRLLEAYLCELAGRVLPGVNHWLDHLVQCDHVHVGLLTGNIRAAAHVKLRHYGLAHYFPFGGFGDVHTDRAQVADQALDAARQYLNTPIDTRAVWIVGDTPLDIACARAVGARVVAVATGTYSADQLADHDPDVLIASLQELNALQPLVRNAEG